MEKTRTANGVLNRCGIVNLVCNYTCFCIIDVMQCLPMFNAVGFPYSIIKLTLHHSKLTHNKHEINKSVSVGLDLYVFLYLGLLYFYIYIYIYIYINAV